MSDDSQLSEGSWILWFCNLEEHQFLCEVDEDYIKDNFNLYGLKPKFPHYDEAIDLILSEDTPTEEDLEDPLYHEIYQEATDLYGLIHARYLLSPKGLSGMREKYLMARFGVCPRVLCERQPVLPIGMSEELRTSRVKVYCPRCEDVYIPKKKCKNVDGAYFACSMPHILLMTYPELTPLPLTATFVPRVYGFRLYKKKGSKFAEDNKKLSEITYYGEEQLKIMKATLNAALGCGPEKPMEIVESSDSAKLKKDDGDMIIEKIENQPAKSYNTFKIFSTLRK